MQVPCSLNMHHTATYVDTIAFNLIAIASKYLAMNSD